MILEKIAEYRKKRGLTQAELAELAGISQQYMSNIERGKVNPGIGLIEKILLILDVRFLDYEN